MLERWDYVVIVFYLVFTMSIGFVCKRISRNSSDFFRGGGNMLWWMTGMSGIASGLSAWTFTAAASRVYELGFFMIILYWLWVPAYLLLYFFMSSRFRQMRVITVADAIKRRYGRATEQFWVWVQVPCNLMIAAMWLMTVSIFISAAVDIPLNLCILTLGIAVTCVSLGAGAWSVIASDFLQITIILTCSITVLVRSLCLPEVGGISGFFDKIPAAFTNFSLKEAPSVWITFLVVSGLMRMMQANDLSTEAFRFLTSKDGDQAKKASLLMIVGFVIVPVIAFVPVMICSFVIPNLGEVFPNLQSPMEGAYMGIAAHVLPTGMVGLIVCAMFAASISSIDTALNRNAGFFVQNVYLQFVRPKAGAREQLFMGRMFTVILALVLITLATVLANNRDMGLFEFSNLVFSLVVPPMVVPAVFGFIYKRTPSWTGWSTAVVGFLAAFATKFGPGWVSRFSSTHVSQEGFTNWVGRHVFGVAGDMNGMERGDVTFITIMLITVTCGISWFFFTSLFYKGSRPAHKKRVEALFTDMRTPIDHVAEKNENRDAIQYKLIGSLTVVFGSVLLLGVLIPNEFRERLLFLYCGGGINTVGLILLAIYRKKKQTLAFETNDTAAV
ncbi:hypothetical protein ACFL6U_09525 [Planctomycetota bacterium]